MTYVKQTWADDNPVYPVSAARMAHIEDGIAAVEAAIPPTPPTDPAAGTAGLRTLGTGAQQAMAGNDSRVTGATTDLQRLAYIGLQAGVYASGDLMVTQRGAGANMSVDVAAGTVLVPSATSGLLVTVVKASVTNVAVTAAHASNPRIDQAVIDTAGVISVLAGTPTADATNDNRNGAAALPAGTLRLGDIFVAAASSTVSNSSIRDRRPWARGADYRIIRSSADYTTTSLSLVVVDSTNLNPRIECSGAPIEVLVTSNVTGSASARIDAEVRIDGVSQSQIRRFQVASGSYVSVVLRLDATPSAGSHLFAPYWATSAGTATLEASSGVQLAMRVREIVAQDARNNSTTSG